MRPTAIFANNDYAAVIAMSAAQQMGLAIPDDISVVGYDNSYLARLGYIGLTTIDNNYVEMGRSPSCASSSGSTLQTRPEPSLCSTRRSLYVLRSHYAFCSSVPNPIST